MVSIAHAETAIGGGDGTGNTGSTGSRSIAKGNDSSDSKSLDTKEPPRVGYNGTGQGQMRDNNWNNKPGGDSIRKRNDSKAPMAENTKKDDFNSRTTLPRPDVSDSSTGMNDLR